MKCTTCYKEVKMLQYKYNEEGKVDYASGGFCDLCFYAPKFPFPSPHANNQTFTVVHKTSKGVYCNSYTSKEQADIGAVTSIMEHINEFQDSNFKDGIVQVLKSGRIQDGIHYYNMYAPNKTSVEVFEVDPPMDAYVVQRKFNMLMGIWEEASSNTKG